MPRYFFDVFDGLSDRDQDLHGSELNDVHAAQAEAVRMSGEILRDMGPSFWERRVWRLEVSDADRKLLFSLHFKAEEHRLP